MSHGGDASCSFCRALNGYVAGDSLLCWLCKSRLCTHIFYVPSHVLSGARRALILLCILYYYFSDLGGLFVVRGAGLSSRSGMMSGTGMGA